MIKLAESNSEALIKISDNGCGISAEIQDRVFDHFFTSKETGKGTGIGLSIVNRIVRDHNGSINFTSTDKGTCFVVHLPLVNLE